MIDIIKLFKGCKKDKTDKYIVNYDDIYEIIVDYLLRVSDKNIMMIVNNFGILKTMEYYKNYSTVNIIWDKNINGEYKYLNDSNKYDRLLSWGKCSNDKYNYLTLAHYIITQYYMNLFIKNNHIIVEKTIISNVRYSDLINISQIFKGVDKDKNDKYIVIGNDLHNLIVNYICILNREEFNIIKQIVILYGIFEALHDVNYNNHIEDLIWDNENINELNYYRLLYFIIDELITIINDIITCIPNKINSYDNNSKYNPECPDALYY
jgi:hypothetical protein